MKICVPITYIVYKPNKLSIYFKTCGSHFRIYLNI